MTFLKQKLSFVFYYFIFFNTCHDIENMVLLVTFFDKLSIFHLEIIFPAKFKNADYFGRQNEELAKQAALLGCFCDIFLNIFLLYIFNIK
jgi:hypothetical protein